MGPLARKVVVLLLVAIWGARLTFNWLRRWEGLGHEDWRYVAIRRKSGRNMPSASAARRC